MIKFLLFSTLLLLSNPKDFELSIYKYSLKGDTLTLYYSIKNNTDSVRTFINTGFSTFPLIQSFTLFIRENDTLELQIQNLYPNFFPSKLKGEGIFPHDSVCGKFDVYLDKLYLYEKMPPNPSYQIIGTCSFQLIYYDDYVRESVLNKYKVYDKNGKRIKNYRPIPDLLYSNIIYIDR